MRRDPFAMLPFMGYNMSDYFAHWLKLGEQLGSKAPAMFCVNWFRKGENGKFVWPGYGDNMRVLAWMLDRIAGKAEGSENAFGIGPKYDEINWTGLPFTHAHFETVTHIGVPEWTAELKLHEDLFEQLKLRLPAALPATKAAIEARLAAN